MSSFYRHTLVFKYFDIEPLNFSLRFLKFAAVLGCEGFEL